MAGFLLYVIIGFGAMLALLAFGPLALAAAGVIFLVSRRPR